jgi:tetratricopeptide (TPR) repeat protein
VKRKLSATALAALVVAVAVAPPVEARHFKIAGGIQYVIQGTKEKEKGNLEDANRIFGKAVTNLSEGVVEDPKDDEAWIYLGQAYGEVRNFEESGKAFAEALRRVQDNPKWLKRATDNRDYYFNNEYNLGLSKYKEATAILPAEEIPNSTDPKAAEAKAKLAEAEQQFKNALLINDQRAIAYDNLAIMLALQGKFDQAGPVVDAGLAKAMPQEGEEYERLKQRKDSLYNNAVVERLKANDHDGAIAMLETILEKNPNDFGVLTRAAQTTFEKAEKLGKDKDEAGAKAAYAKAAGYFARASAAAPDSQNRNDMQYNQAIASQQAGDAKAAATAAFALVQANPKDLSYHRLLRTGYDKMGAQKKADEQTWVILGLNEQATSVADLADFTSKVAKTSEAGKALAELGPPEEVRQFTNGDLKVEVWYWYGKKRAVAFTGGRQVGAANFGEFAADVPAPATKPAAKAGATKKG